MDIIHKIIDDLGYRDIINIQLITFNKKQEQVKRTFKLRKLYLVRCIIHTDKFKGNKPALF